MKTISRGGTWLVAGCAVWALACAQPKQPPQRVQLAHAVEPPSRLQPPEPLPEPARQILKTIMASHAEAMTDLVSAIMILSYPRIESEAEIIAQSSALARPLTGDATELNSLLPDRLFDLQAQLRVEARALALAARREKPLEVADAYGQLSQTCVKCHATYRFGR